MLILHTYKRVTEYIELEVRIGSKSCKKLYINHLIFITVEGQLDLCHLHPLRVVTTLLQILLLIFCRFIKSNQAAATVWRKSVRQVNKEEKRNPSRRHQPPAGIP